MYALSAASGRPAAAAFDDGRWSGIPSPQQRAEAFTTRHPVFFEDDETEFVFEILEGVVCCYRMLSDGRRQVLSFCFAGDLIGFVQGDRHLYSAETLGPARIRRIPRNMLLKAAFESPELGRKLLQYAARELVGMQEHAVTLGRKSAREKVAWFLLDFARRYVGEDATSVTFRLPMTRADIADYLGLTLETVSRTLTKLRMSRVVDMPQPSTVVVADLDRLEDMAEAEDGAGFGRWSNTMRIATEAPTPMASA